MQSPRQCSPIQLRHRNQAVDSSATQWARRRAKQSQPRSKANPAFVVQGKAANAQNQPDGVGRSALGTLLRGFRVAAGLSQAELAERAEMSTGAIGSLEQGSRRAPYRSTLDSLADALNLCIEDREQLYSAAKLGRGRRSNRSSEQSFSSNAPIRLTSFVQRPETDDVARLLAEHRLVTVTGFAGVGKTRTVLEVAASYNSSDVVFVDLAPINRDDLVPLEIASAFRIPIDDAESIPQGLVSALRDRRALIVLDNCEHVLSGVAAIVLELLRSAPTITIVATSREALGLSSEVVYKLPFLNVPPRGAQLSIGSAYSALELFISRAQAADARLVFSSDDLEAAAEICRRLDGIPLAIELAAGRAATLGVIDLRDRLNDLSFASAAIDIPTRHHTMSAAISWSFTLLTPQERTLIRRLSTLAGNFSLRCAERVCSDDRLRAEAIPDLVVQLIQKSLVESAAAPSGYRYSMLASVRAYASSRLTDAGETAANEDRLTRYLLGLIPGGEKRDVSTPQIVPDLDNIRVAVEAMLRRGSPDDVATAGELVGSFRRLWTETGRRLELRRLCETILPRLDVRKFEDIASKLASALVGTTHSNDQYDYLQNAIRVNSHVGNYASASAHLSQLAEFHVSRGKMEQAIDAAGQAENLLSRVSRNNRAQWYVRINLAFVWSEHGEYAKARSYVKEIDHLLSEQRDSIELTIDSRARDMLLAEIEFAAGNYELARTICRDTIAKRQSSQDSLRQSDLNLMATHLAAHLKLHDISAAEAVCREMLDSWALFTDFDSENVMFCVIQDAGMISASRGHFVEAAMLLGCADAQLVRYGRTRSIQQRATASDLREVLKHSIEADQLSALELDGSQMTIPEALDLIEALLDDHLA
jgi:predicted ATPase/transcriptional regulator with XRE-family HTH domain/tetratricopeptide (TPR) repeat protein